MIIETLIDSKPWCKVTCPQLYQAYKTSCYRAGHPEDLLSSDQVVLLMKQLGYTLKSYRLANQQIKTGSQELIDGLNRNKQSETNDWYWFHIQLK